MILSESIFWSLDDCDSISGLKIFCDDSQKEEIKNFFKDTFMEEWNILLDQVEQKNGNCLEKDKKINPILGISNFNKGILITFNSFLISYKNGDIFSANISGDTALKNTLEKLEKKYSNISYEGYIGYRYSTSNGGNIVQYTISSNKKKDNDKVYDFIGEILSTYTDDEDFWDNFKDELYDYEDEEDFIEILDHLLAYKKWVGQETIDKFLDIVEEIDEDIRESLEDKLNDD